MARRKKKSPPLEKLLAQQRIDELRVDVHRLKAQLKDERRAHNRTLARVHHERDRADFALGIQRKSRRRPRALRPRTGKRIREACPLVLASDWHLAETVDPAEINGRNTYNLEIARRRAANFFDGVDWLVKWMRSPGKADRGFAIPQLTLWLGGDLMTGHIHEELAETTGLSPTQEAMFAQDVIESGIRHLLDSLELERLHVPCSYGNHGRTTPKKRIATAARHSYEWMIYHQLAKTFKGDERVTFDIADGALLYLDILGTQVRATHLDTVRYGGGVGGITIPIKKRIARWNKTQAADLTVGGHFHTFIDGGDFVVNGSLKGYDAFALAFGFEYEPPVQAFILIDEKRGKSLVAPIWVEEK